MKHGFFALKSGEWEEHKSIFKATEWAFERIREACAESGKRGGGKIDHRTKNYVEEYRLLAAHHCASRRARRCHDVITVPKLQQFFFWKTTCGGFQLARSTSSWWCAICGEKYDWRAPNRLLVVQTCR